MELLNRDLPLWVSEIEDEYLDSRLDNNWYSPAALLAEGQIRTAAMRGGFKIISVSSLCESDGINTGVSPEDEGSIGVIEGRNLKPNYIVPLFTKFADEATNLKEGDLLIGKDGEPGTVSLVTESLLRYCERVAVGCHVYHLKLLEHYRPLAPFISAFFNSRTGQALLRKRIAGGTTPTIRSDDLKTTPIIIPADETCPEDIRSAVVMVQDSVIASMENLGASKLTVAYTGIGETDIRLPTNWAGGGAARSSRILS